MVARRSWLGPLVAAVVMVVVVGALYLSGRAREARVEAEFGPTPRAAEVDVYESFQTVRNDCGACGTDSPVGGWEAEDGRSLVLSGDGSFVAFFADDTSMTGSWAQTGGQLCLSPESGGRQCFSYEQRVDAMRLDEAIYIRR